MPIELVDNGDLRHRKAAQSPATIDALKKLCRNKLGFALGRVYAKGGREVSEDLVEFYTEVYCCRSAHDRYRGPSVAAAKEKTFQRTSQVEMRRLKNETCTHQWQLNKKDRAKDHVHNFGNGKQWLYVCSKCGARSKRDVTRRGGQSNKS